MAFTSETAKKAGQKSKRGQDTQLKELRQFVIDFLEQNNDSLQEVFDEVKDKDPAKALDFLYKLNRLVVPTPKAIDVAPEVNEVKDIVINFKD